MNPLALDLSLTATGWAMSVDEHGVYQTGNLRGIERLTALQDWLIEMLYDHGPDIVVLEGYAMGARGRSVFNIGEWGGVARLAINQAGILYVEVAPATLKKFATGRGNAPKPDMRMELYKRASLDLADDNEVDALWLLAATHEAYGEPLWEMPKVNVEALEKVQWPAVRGGVT